jgi:hypothetical protein
MRRVLAAAVRDKQGIIWSLPAPCRHHDILKHIPDEHTAEQGFILTDGTFVDRVTAKSYAMMNQQILEGELRGQFRELFSEDMW